ncbi:hypothetical protein FALBO_7863, partial [Fusarium albosuccineum]
MVEESHLPRIICGGGLKNAAVEDHEPLQLIVQYDRIDVVGQVHLLAFGAEQSYGCWIGPIDDEGLGLIPIIVSLVGLDCKPRGR